MFLTKNLFPRPNSDFGDFGSGLQVGLALVSDMYVEKHGLNELFRALNSPF